MDPESLLQVHVGHCPLVGCARSWYSSRAIVNGGWGATIHNWGVNYYVKLNACIVQVQLAVQYSRAQVAVGSVGDQLPALVPSLIQVICRADPLVVVGAYPVTQPYRWLCWCQGRMRSFH